jgi:hypothetical protein
VRGQLRFDGSIVEAVKAKFVGSLGEMDIEIDVPGEEHLTKGETLYVDDLKFDTGDRLEVTIQYRCRRKGLDHPTKEEAAFVEYTFEPVMKTFNLERVIPKAQVEEEELQRAVANA